MEDKRANLIEKLAAAGEPGLVSAPGDEPVMYTAEEMLIRVGVRKPSLLSFYWEQVTEPMYPMWLMLLISVITYLVGWSLS